MDEMNAMTYRFSYDLCIGSVTIIERGGYVVGVSLSEGVPHLKDFSIRETPIIAACAEQLRKYVQGDLKQFSVPINPTGTPFQLSVWRALVDIPYGETRSYSAIARAIGNPKAVRAVGMANNRNPISFIIPCHRVIGSDGSLVGYGGGLALKEWLLDLERGGSPH